MSNQFKNQALSNFVMESSSLCLEERPYKGKVGGHSIEMVISRKDNVYDSFIYKNDGDRDYDLNILMNLLYDD
jgi:hypothetical protein